MHHFTIQNNLYSKPQYCPGVSANMDFLFTQKHNEKLLSAKGKLIFKSLCGQYFTWHSKLLDTIMCWTNCILDICHGLLFRMF